MTKEEKTINDFLCKLTEAQTYMIDELARLVQSEIRDFSEKIAILKEFITSVRSECLMDGHYFTFHSLPELIVKKKYKKQQFQVISKLLVNIRSAYLESKLQPEPSSVEDPKNTKEEQERAASGVITEEDMVDVSFLDEQVSLVEKKFRDKEELWQSFIVSCRQEAEKKQKDLSADTQKTKNLIEQSVFASFLNDKLYEKHVDVFTKSFQLNIMNYKFVERAQHMTTADEYLLTYRRIVECTKGVVGNPFRQEYLENKEAEMDRFCGKAAAAGDEGKSETSYS